MDDLFANPPFSIAIIWHPDFKDGAEIAAHLHQHFRCETFHGVARSGIEVVFRWQPEPGQKVPAPLPIKPDRCQAVLLLVEDHLQDALDEGWREYLDEIIAAVEATQKASLVYPVAFDKNAFSVLPRLSPTNFIRWYDSNDLRRRTAELTHQFCRLLRPWVEAVEAGQPLPPVIGKRPPAAMTVFISHAKQDGEELALKVRESITRSSLKSFFDAHDIPPGWRFEDVIEENIQTSSLLVVQTDSFSSSEWCRREVLTARRCQVPVVVFNAIREGEARSFPYGGNVPVVMGGVQDENRITLALARLLDEALKDLYWRLHREFILSLAQKIDPEPVLLTRAPDLLSLVHLTPRPRVVVYPDPPLGDAEISILQKLIDQLHLVTPTSLYTAP